MKVFNTDGTLLMEFSELSRNGNNLEFRSKVMGTMPVKGRLVLPMRLKYMNLRET